MTNQKQQSEKCAIFDLQCLTHETLMAAAGKLQQHRRAKKVELKTFAMVLYSWVL